MWPSSPCPHTPDYEDIAPHGPQFHSPTLKVFIKYPLYTKQHSRGWDTHQHPDSQVSACLKDAEGNIISDYRTSESYIEFEVPAEAATLELSGKAEIYETVFAR